MSGLITSHYKMLFVMSRFGIPLGFGDKTIEEVCSENDIDVATFLVIVEILLEAADYRHIILFLEASDDVIVQRQESNRRPLPLQYGGQLLKGIVHERRLLADLRASADIVVDTSRLSARQLAQRVSNHFGTDATDNLSVALMSFGFKNGLPVDADIVFDVRFLPNPY